MIYLKGLVTCILVLATMVFSASKVLGAEDFIILRFTDGTTQRIRLDRPADSIRQIEFLEGRRAHGYEDRGYGRIKVIAASYGRNCGAPYGNVTTHLAAACDGKALCEYIIDVKALGDPAGGCSKDFYVEWQCGGNPEKNSLNVNPEATGTKIILRCPPR